MVKRIIKNVGGPIIGSGVALVVSSIIKSNTNTPAGFVSKVLFSVGSAAIGGYLATKVRKNFEENVDKHFTAVENK